MTAWAGCRRVARHWIDARSKPLTPSLIPLTFGILPRSPQMLARLLLILLVVPSLRSDAPPTAAALDQIPPAMQKYMAANDISGAVTVVGRSDGFTHVTAVGFRNVDAKKPMEKETLFRIASMTKPVTAIGILILA